MKNNSKIVTGERNANGLSRRNSRQRKCQHNEGWGNKTENKENSIYLRKDLNHFNYSPWVRNVSRDYLELQNHFVRHHHNFCMPTQSLLRISTHKQPCHLSDDARTRYLLHRTALCMILKKVNQTECQDITGNMREELRTGNSGKLKQHHINVWNRQLFLGFCQEIDSPMYRCEIHIDPDKIKIREGYLF